VQIGDGRSLADLEREAIRIALHRHGGNRRLAADELGIGVRTLYDKIRRYALETP
jgi:transcriptional regulator with PAS, ATPase and Fis domain